MTNTPSYFRDYELEALMEWLIARQSLPQWSERVFWVWTLLGTGTRIDEARSIRTEHCHPDFVHLVTTKGGRPRDVEFIPEMAWLYRRHADRAREQGKLWLFPCRYIGGSQWAKGRLAATKDPRDPGPMSLRTARNWWYEVIDRVGVSRLHPHCARHTFRAWEKERLSVEDLADQLGHTIKTAERHYRHSLPGRRYAKPVPRWREIARDGEHAPAVRLVVNQD